MTQDILRDLMAARITALDFASRTACTGSPEALVKAADHIYKFITHQLPDAETNTAVSEVRPETFRDFFRNYVRPVNPVYNARPISFIENHYQSACMEAIDSTGEARGLSVIAPRQSGMTQFWTAYALYRCLTEKNFVVMIASNKYSGAVDCLDRIRRDCPDVLNTISSASRDMITFDNGSKIIARAVSVNATRGLSIDLFIVDNAAYVAHKLAPEFMVATWPSLVSTKGKMILVSTVETDGVDPESLHGIATNLKCCDLRNLASPIQR